MKIEEIKHLIKFETINRQPLGGQSCGIIYSDIRMEIPELNLKIECGYSKTTLKNKEMIIKMLETFLNDIK